MPLPHSGLDALSARDLREVLGIQRGVISRDQLLRAGYPPGFGRGKVRHGAWQRLHPGVYLTNTGIVSLDARLWATLLAGPPGAVLAGETAAYVDGWLGEPPRRIHLVAPHAGGSRKAPTGAVLRLQRREIQHHLMPPRTTVAATALDLVTQAQLEDDVVGALTAAAQCLGSSAPLRAELQRRTRIRHRSLVVAVLSRDQDGHESPLEWHFTQRVLRPHRLPIAVRQARLALGAAQVRADQWFSEFAIRVELDGRIHLRKADDDVWRDNSVLLQTGELTLRYRWSHVVGQPCAVAAQLQQAFARRGWSGSAVPCGPSCQVRQNRSRARSA